MLCLEMTSYSNISSTQWDKVSDAFPFLSQICSINSENAPVAHWVLLARHAVILLPLCTANQRLEVAHFLIKSLTQKSKSTKTDQPGYVVWLLSDEGLMLELSTFEFL